MIFVLPPTCSGKLDSCSPFIADSSFQTLGIIIPALMYAQDALVVRSSVT